MSMGTRFVKPAIFIIVFLTIGYIVFNLLNKQTSQEDVLSALLSIQPTRIITPTPTKLFSRESLKNAVEETLEGTKGTYGIVIKNLKTGETYTFNEHEEFEPGSLYKIWVMATVFNQIQRGQLNEDKILSESIEVLNSKFNITSESAELTTGTITLTVKQALNQMITISHNYAALLLSAKVRLSTVRNFLEEQGFNESALGEPPMTTVYDIALFFEKLYMGELADEENTNKMIDLLKKQTLNQKIPKYLPEDTAIAHKTGEIGGFSHDAGIVFGKNTDYIIVVFSESNIPSAAEERIAEISKSVFEYFEK